MRGIRAAIVIRTAFLGVGAIPLLLLVVGQSFAENPAVNVKNVKEDGDHNHSRLSGKYRVEVQTDTDHNHDERPSGKYLVEICTLSSENRTLVCSPTPLASQPPPKVPTTPPKDASVQPRDQKITLKLTCDPATMSYCIPSYPVVVGKIFFVAGTADSGGGVQQTVHSGPATLLKGGGTVQYYAKAPGLVIIRGTLAAIQGFAPAEPVDLPIQVIADQSKAPEACDVLPAPALTKATLLDARRIVSMLGDPAPFLLDSLGPNTIAIYSTRQPLDTDARTILDSFRDSIAALAGHPPTAFGIDPMPAEPFSVELTIAHANALGDLAVRVNGLHYKQLAVEKVGSDKIRVTALAWPECRTWKAFLSNIRDMEWQLISAPMSTKLFYLSSSDVATAFTSLASGAPVAAIGVGSIVPALPTSGASTEAGAAGATSDPPSAPAASTTPPGSNAASSTSQPQATPAASGGTPAPKTNTSPSVTVTVGAAQQPPPDLLVFSDTNPGDDAPIQERLRIIAQLDLPRPEMIINAWVTQNSSSSGGATGEFINLVKDLVAGYDREFQGLVLRGWRSLKTQSSAPGYFNEPFRSYVADRFVADTFQEKKPGNTIQALSQAFLDHTQARLTEAPGNRITLGICERNRYCLGYYDLFRPLKPALTDLLLMIFAAQDPVKAADAAIEDVEGRAPLARNEKTACDVKDDAVESRCRAIWNTLAMNSVSPLPARRTCADEDFRGILASLLAPSLREPRIHLRCFAQQMHLLFSNSGGAPPSGVGLVRAAIADFLFNYKMSQQYPHEFVAYDLGRSADALNAGFNPIIDAFNRDLTTYQLFVRADMQYRVEHLNAGKTSFFNDGLITVRTISGQLTNVNTTSQSFLDASTAPQLSTLLSSLGANPNAAGTGSQLSAVPAANPLISTQALATALANYQTTVAQIGRDLNISALPRSLAAASSAEIAVTLNAADSAGSPIYTGPGQNDPSVNTSRVARHETTTRVRVDSVKLFEISSLTGIVERSRSRFPLLPPFVEIPYIGTIVGIPLPAAKEYHASTAILSAYVVPTATDIAYGLRFAYDLVVDGLNPGRCSFYKEAAGPGVTNTCLFRRAFSLQDLNNHPVRNFNREMIRCLAMHTSANDCWSVSFDRVLDTRP
jgi:hypothetical protein